MFKKILSLLLCLLLIFSFAACNKDEKPGDNTPDDDIEDDGNKDNTPILTRSGTVEGTHITWEVYSDHVMYLKCPGGHAAGEECVLPDMEVADKTSNQPWYENGGKNATDRTTDGGATTVTKLVIGEGITALGQSAFEKMELLTEVILPSTLKTISFKSFRRCPQLKTVSGGKNVTVIESEAFLSCTNLETVEVTVTLTEVQDMAFSGVIAHNVSKKLTVKVYGDADGWAATMERLRNTENADGFPCLGSENEAFENATVEYIAP